MHLLFPCCLLLSAAAGAVCGWRLIPKNGDAPPHDKASPPPSAAVSVNAAERELRGPLAELAAKVRDASMEELPSLHGTLAAWPDAWLRDAARDMIFQRMCELDAPAALRWARKNPGGDKKAFVHLLRAWAEVDPDGALDAAFAATSSMTQAQENASIVLAHLAMVRPDKFFAHAKVDPTAASHDVFTKAMQSLARRDPAAALREYESLTEKVKAGMTGPFAEGWARKDLPGALAWARQLPEPARQGALFGIVTEIGPRDPHTALREAAAYLEKDGEARQAPVWVVKAIARGLTRENPEKALEWAQAHSSGADARKTIGWEVLPAIAAGDGPDAAARIVRALGDMDGEDMAGGLKNFLSTWQPADPGAQVMSMAPLEYTNARTQLIDAAAALWARRDPAAVQQAAQETTDKFLRWSLGDALGNYYSNARDADAFLEVMPLLDPDYAESICGTMAKRLAWESTAQGVDFISKLPADSPERRAAIERMAPYFGMQEPAAAIQWVESLAGEERTRATAHIIQSWAGEDPLAVSQWVQTLPPGHTRDAGAGMLAVNLLRTEPDSAFAWMQTVSDDATRESLYGPILSSWTRLDAAAARQSIEDAHIPDTTRERLRAQFDVFSLQPK